MVSGTFTGDAALSASLLALSVEMRKSAALKAVKAGAAPMRDRIAQLAPRGDVAPHIADNIIVSVQSKIDGVRIAEGAAAVAIGPEKRFFYGWFWEFGWKFHLTPWPFVRRGFEELKDEAMRLMGASLWASVKSSTKG